MSDGILWPGHYSPADVNTVMEILRWLDEKSYSQAALARLAKVSSSSLNQIIKGGYASPPTELLAKILSAMRNAEQAASDAITTVETGVLSMGHACCRHARRYRNFAVFTGYVGIGKTHALKHYAATNSNTFIIDATPTMSVNSLIKRLTQLVAGYDVKGSISDKFDAIIAALKNTDSLLIIDEAETLTSNQLHTLRRIRDLANVGIVFSGTEYLSGMLKPTHGQFDQIRSRCGFWPETITAITLEDSAALIQSFFGKEEVPDDVVEHIYKYSAGSARMLVEAILPAIRNFRGNRPLSKSLVNAAAKQALSLQVVR